MGEKIGYIRISSVDQNEARQEELMSRLGVDRVFIDKVSGKDTNRPEFKKMMDYIRAGDTLIVESYSRLSRSTVDLINTVEKLNEKGVHFVSQKESIDTSTPQGRMMMTIFAGIYQFERETLLQRQREGIEIAKKEGKYRGRTPISVDKKDFEKVYKEWKAGDITAVAAMKRLGVKKTTFYQRVKEFEKENPELSKSVQVESKDNDGL